MPFCSDAHYERYYRSYEIQIEDAVEVIINQLSGKEKEILCKKVFQVLRNLTGKNSIVELCPFLKEEGDIQKAVAREIRYYFEARIELDNRRRSFRERPHNT
jgi:hypothetical protein